MIFKMRSVSASERANEPVSERMITLETDCDLCVLNVQCTMNNRAMRHSLLDCSGYSQNGAGFNR